MKRILAIALSSALLALGLVWLVFEKKEPPMVSVQETLLVRQTQELGRLVAAAEHGSLFDFDGILVVVDQGLVQELVRGATPLEADGGGGFHVRVESAEASFADGLAVVRLDGTASVAGKTASADVKVYGAIDVVALDSRSGVLTCRVSVSGVEAVHADVLGIHQPVRRLTEALTHGGLALLLGSIEIPVRIEDRLSIPAVDDHRLRIASVDLPVQVAVQDVKVWSGKLWVTVYHTDDEAFDIWNKEVGVPAERIVRIGDNKGAPFASDNFWQMADTGPCGPCTEIFYDHGAGIAGGPPGSPDEDGDRFIEIWNLVFMQFDRAPDGSLSPLPAPCVDTGMGLERLAAVLQHVHSNYEIDLFAHLIRVAGELTRTSDLSNKSLRVIADHIRACSSIVDSVLPSTKVVATCCAGSSARLARHGWMLGVRGDCFWKMVQPLVRNGRRLSELATKQAFVEDALRAENRWRDSLERMRVLTKYYEARHERQNVQARMHSPLRHLWFPVDLTADIARSAVSR